MKNFVKSFSKYQKKSIFIELCYLLGGFSNEILFLVFGLFIDASVVNHG
jgi:hypothetical protein